MIIKCKLNEFNDDGEVLKIGFISERGIVEAL